MTFPELKKRKNIFIIAEAGVNHNGSREMAKELIDAAAEAGADAVKFQTFKADLLLTRTAPKAEYQRKRTKRGESQWEMIRKLELSEKLHYDLSAYCLRKGIEFLSSPFDLDSLDLLLRMGVKKLKIPSGEITNALLLLKAASAELPMILSTGMSTQADIKTALGIIAFGLLRNPEKPALSLFRQAVLSPNGIKLLKKKVALLHCTTEYPAAYEDVNLFAMEKLRRDFGLCVGLSDHTTGIAIPIAAAALGAEIIEKHFTLDPDLDGPDHKSSLNPREFKEMVSAIRHVEISLGSPIKKPAPGEVDNREIVRKSLVAVCRIKKGEIFTTENLTTKRPGTGVPALNFWDWLGKKASRSYEADELIGP